MSKSKNVEDLSFSNFQTISINEPFDRFNQWFEEAKAKESNDPNAMALATVDKNTVPNVRMVLMKEINQKGLVFYTNFESQKGLEIADNPSVATCFHWKSIRRSVRIRGPVEEVSQQEADDYFNSRPRDSRIGAWASQQSRPLESRFALEKEVAKYAAKFAIGKVPRPPYWSGYRIIPTYTLNSGQIARFDCMNELFILEIQGRTCGRSSDFSPSCNVVFISETSIRR